MARFDVYRDPRGSDNLLLCIQADLFESLDTRLAIPLLPDKPERKALHRLNPVAEIGGRRYVIFTQHAVAVPASAMRNPVANLREQRDAIVGALDFLCQGF